MSASDGTNVVKVGLHLCCLKCACVIAFATSYRICLWCCTSLRYFSFLLAWETEVGKSKSIVDTSDYKSVHEASRLCFHAYSPAKFLSPRVSRAFRHEPRDACWAVCCTRSVRFVDFHRKQAPLDFRKILLASGRISKCSGIGAQE